MSWNGRDMNGFPFGGGFPMGRRGPWEGRGVDRAPDADTTEFPWPQGLNFDPFAGLIGGPHGGPYEGPHGSGHRGRGPFPHMYRGGGFHGRRGFRTRREQDSSDDAGKGSSRDAQPANPSADPPISTPDQLNDEAASPGTAVPDDAPGSPHTPPSSRASPAPQDPPPYPGAHHAGHAGHRGRGGRHTHPGGCRGGRHGGRPGPEAHPWSQQFGVPAFIEAIFPGAFPGAAAASQRDTSESSTPFVPPVDLFATPTAYVLHVALPGAKKSDIGVDWNPDASTLRVAGVVHRPGDEALLASLLPNNAERRVGYFERFIRLPPREAADPFRRWQQRAAKPRGTTVGEDTELPDYMDEDAREEIDAAAITARMEDGVLIVTVPRLEKGWTEVTKVDVM